ncbi:MAG: metal ABC transporter permease [Verrucomicrobiales bacterium]|nr:metal ABC transporter permease [Verrucomicrobiales bacterium]
MFQEPFMQRALLTALILGPLCGALGVFVTARRMSFFSDTVAHSALAGVAAGLALGWNPSGPMVAVSLLVGLLILWLREHTELLTDTIMALLMSGFMAAGVVAFSLLRGFRGELHRYLFGDILSVGPPEVALAAGLGALVLGVLFLRLSPLTLVTAHEDLAHVSGVSVRRLNLLFVVVLTLVVAISIRLLGIILVTSLLVIPPAAARNLACNLRQELALSLGAGLVGGGGGVILSYQLDLPCGPTIVLACVALFLLTLGLSSLRRRPSVVPAPSR